MATAHSATRHLRWATLGLPLLAYVVIYFVDGTGFHPNGDGYYSWIFARSLAFDGDVELRNDYALCGDPFTAGVDRGTGHPDNPFYIGPAAFWVPPLLVVRLLFTLFAGSARAATASCAGSMTALTILAGPACGALSVWLSYKSARLVVRDKIAIFTALVFAFNSPLFPYSTSVAHYSHVYLTVTVAALVYLALRTIVEGPRRWDAAWVAAAVAIAILHRLPALLYAALPAAALVTKIRARDLRAAAHSLVGIAIGAVVGVGGTLSLYRYLYGHWLALPQGPDYVHMAHAHPWLLLFGVRGGFFFWMPAAWLAVVGLFFAWRRTDLRWFLLATLAAFSAELVVSSAPLDWHGNWSLGARRLLPLTPAVVVFAALAVERILDRFPRLERRASILGAAIVLLLLVNNIPASTTLRGDRELTQAELYGALSPLRPLWSLVDRTGVDLALVPAEAFFAARYGLPPSAYRAAITPHYKRNYRTLRFTETDVDLTKPDAARVISGSATWSPRGVTVTGAARIVFTTEWLVATHARLFVTAPSATSLTLAARRAFGASRPIGAVTIPRATEGAWVEVALPPDTFDSGLNEWTIDAASEVTIGVIDLADRTPRTPHG